MNPNLKKKKKKFKTFDCVSVAVCLQKGYGVSGLIFGFISLFLNNRWLRVVLDGKFLQGVSVKAGFPQDSSLGAILNNVLCNLACSANNST